MKSKVELSGYGSACYLPLLHYISQNNLENIDSNTLIVNITMLTLCKIYLSLRCLSQLWEQYNWFLLSCPPGYCL